MGPARRPRASGPGNGGRTTPASTARIPASCGRSGWCSRRATVAGPRRERLARFARGRALDPQQSRPDRTPGSGRVARAGTRLPGRDGRVRPARPCGGDLQGARSARSARRRDRDRRDPPRRPPRTDRRARHADVRGARRALGCARVRAARPRAARGRRRRDPVPQPPRLPRHHVRCRQGRRPDPVPEHRLRGAAAARRVRAGGDLAARPRRGVRGARGLGRGPSRPAARVDRRRAAGGLARGADRGVRGADATASGPARLARPADERDHRHAQGGAAWAGAVIGADRGAAVEGALSLARVDVRRRADVPRSRVHADGAVGDARLHDDRGAAVQPGARAASRSAGGGRRRSWSCR